MAAILIILGIPALLAALVLLEGYVLSILWRWFAVTAFHAPDLSVMMCVGLALMVRAVVPRELGQNDKSWDTTLAIAVLDPLATLLMGWIVRQFL